MKAFVINLDKNPERLAFVREQLLRLGFEAERFSAVYGKGLTAAELAQACCDVRAVIALQRGMTPAMVAVAMSHCGVLRLVVERNLPYALVLEDDVVLSDGVPRALERIEAAIDASRPQVYSLNGYGLAACDGKSEEIKRVSKMWCADAYVVTRPAAERILAANTPVMTVADDFKRFHRRYGVELYRVLPPTVRQDDARFATENQESSKVPWYLRLPLRGLDWVLWKLTGR